MTDAALTSFNEYVKDMEPFHKLDELTQTLVKSFFIGGYLSGVQSTFLTIKENISEPQSRTVTK